MRRSHLLKMRAHRFLNQIFIKTYLYSSQILKRDFFFILISPHRLRVGPGSYSDEATDQASPLRNARRPLAPSSTLLRRPHHRHRASLISQPRASQSPPPTPTTNLSNHLSSRPWPDEFEAHFILFYLPDTSSNGDDTRKGPIDEIWCFPSNLSSTVDHHRRVPPSSLKYRRFHLLLQ